MRIISFSLLLFLQASLLISQSAILPNQQKPALVVGVVIDNFDANYIYRYWDLLGENGFKKLLSEGLFYSNATHPSLTNQPVAGYANIATGASPATHGIIAETWYLQLKKEIVNATFDNRFEAVQGSFQSGNMSPQQLLCNTFGDQLRLNSGMKSKVYGISLDNKGAVLTAGLNPNAAYWLDNRNGNWITSNYYTDSLPIDVTLFNRKGLAEVYLNREWATYFTIDQYIQANPDNNPYEKGLGNQITFPYNLSRLKSELQFAVLGMLPFGNNYTTDFAISVIANEKLGNDANPDFISIVYTANRQIDKMFGSRSIEMQDCIMRLDKDIEQLLRFLNERFKKENYLLYLTASNGTAEHPQFLMDNKMPSGYFKSKSAIALLKSYLNIVYGKNDWVTYYTQQQIYLNHKLIEDAKIDLKDIQQKVADFMIQFNGVANVLTSKSLQYNNLTGTAFEKLQKGYNALRSGDVILTLNPGWVEQFGDDIELQYSNQVPMIWYGWKTTPQKVHRPVQTIDITPTLCNILNIPTPNGCNGKILDELIK